MRKWAFVFLLFSLFFACRRDSPDSLPQLTIISPADGSQFDVFDTLSVHFTASDNNGLSSYSVKLLDANMSPVLPTIGASLSGSNADLTIAYLLDNIRMLSGYYYLYVEVSDGSNSYRTYKTIYVTAAPKTYKGIFAATIPSVNTLSIYKADTSWSASLFHTYTSDFTDLDVSSYWQQVIFNGSYSGQLRSVPIDGATIEWYVDPIVGSSPYWSFLSVKDARYWISVPGLSMLKCRRQDGTLAASFSSDNGFLPLKNLEVGTRLYTEQKDVSSSLEKMVVYTTSGTPLQEATLPVVVTSLFEKDADNIYVIGNSGGQGQLLIYDYNANGFWSPIPLPTGTVLSAAQIDDETLLIAMSNGSIYKFTYNPVGLLVWNSGIAASHLEFNATDNEVLFSQGTNVKIYDLSPATLLHTIAFSDTVADFALWYNH